jgi:hypothetical protein
VTEGKVKISHDRYATSTPICQLIDPTLKISIATTEVLDTGRGSVDKFAIGRKPVPANRSNYRRIEGGFE